MPKKPPPMHMENIGKKFGKPDLERIGLFSEADWMHGKRYNFPSLQCVKGLNMMAGAPKIKTGKQDCYFDKEYKRIFEGEALKGRGKKPKKTAVKYISSPFMPPGCSKLHSTPGDYYGCFGKIESFGGKPAKKPPFKPEPLNLITNPGKKGGPGYANICINRYPEHINERYGAKPVYKEFGKVLNGPMVTAHCTQPYFQKNPFIDPSPGPTYVRPKEQPKLVSTFIPTGPGKSQGGCHAGCFEKFPEYISNRITKQSKPPKALFAGPFYPQSTGDKTYYSMSVINENIRFRMNNTNLTSFQPTFVKYLAT